MDRINVNGLKDGWQISEGDSDEKKFNTKKEALENARSHAIKNHLQLVIVDKSGKVTDVHDYRKNKLNIRSVKSLVKNRNLSAENLRKAIVQAQITDIV